MGVGPDPFRDGAFESDCFLGIVGYAGAVVCERRASEEHASYYQGQADRQLHTISSGTVAII